jgi:hypothetical protein
MELRVVFYKPSNLAFIGANQVINTFIKRGHCGLLLIGKHVTKSVHFFDDGTFICDYGKDPLKVYEVDSITIGKTPFTMDYVLSYCRSLQNPGRSLAIFERLLWLITFGRYRPRHNCVYNSSMVVNHLFGYPVCHGTPTQLKKIYDSL